EERSAHRAGAVMAIECHVDTRAPACNEISRTAFELAGMDIDSFLNRSRSHRCVLSRHQRLGRSDRIRHDRGEARDQPVFLAEVFVWGSGEDVLWSGGSAAAGDELGADGDDAAVGPELVDAVGFGFAVEVLGAVAGFAAGVLFLIGGGAVPVVLGAGAG